MNINDTTVKAYNMREGKKRALDLAAMLTAHGANGLPGQTDDFEK